MWEASASIRPLHGQPYPMSIVGQKLGKVLVDKVRQMLDGVGDHAAGFWHTDSVSVHLRVPMTAAEMELLPDGWISCPAVERGGREDVMTKEPPFQWSLESA